MAAGARVSSLLLLVACLARSSGLVMPLARRSVAAVHTPPPQAWAVTMMSDEDGTGGSDDAERDSLYTTPSFELDATTVLALLGGAIAFNFFVLANL